MHERWGGDCAAQGEAKVAWLPLRAELLAYSGSILVPPAVNLHIALRASDRNFAEVQHVAVEGQRGGGHGLCATSSYDEWCDIGDMTGSWGTTPPFGECAHRESHAPRAQVQRHGHCAGTIRPSRFEEAQTAVGGFASGLTGKG
jgi:hypothetical protein